ncbi:MAG: choline-sulfatase, partial [Verrucomicrobiales bacterium]|nr:choline-sulfatase [Verrucomicrobiales bacterium]
VIIFWSDHGWHLGEKRHWHKSTLWEESTRIPLIIAVPQLKPDVCDQPVSLLDLYPTLMELCSIKGGHKFDGLSLMPQLSLPETKRNPAVIEFRKGNAAVRSERWRYIRYSDGSEELYDHKTDSYEWENLASKKKYKTVKQNLIEWLPKQWAEPALSKNSFKFDPDSYSWVNKKTGKRYFGSNSDN